MKARASRPNKCPTCTKKITAGQDYKRVTRFAKSGETPTPGLSSNRLAEEIHEDCEDQWKANL